MSIDVTQIEHLAKLARLSLTATEKELYASQLEGVLNYFNKLQELDTTGLEPMSQVIPLENIVRSDLPADCSDEVQKKIIQNAPDKSNRHLRVKKIL